MLVSGSEIQESKVYTNKHGKFLTQTRRDLGISVITGSGVVF